MLFRMDTNKQFPGESLLLTIVKGSSQIGHSSADHVAHIIWSKEMVTQQHILIPSILSTQRRLDVKFFLPQMLEMMSKTLHLSFKKARPVYGARVVIS
jgi:hypothetical protein